MSSARIHSRGRRPRAHASAYGVLLLTCLGCAADQNRDTAPEATADTSIGASADAVLATDPRATEDATPPPMPPVETGPGATQPEPDLLTSPKISAPLRLALAQEPRPDSLLVLITSRPPLSADELGDLTDALLRVRTARGEIATAVASIPALADLVRSDRIVFIELSQPQPGTDARSERR